MAQLTPSKHQALRSRWLPVSPESPSSGRLLHLAEVGALCTPDNKSKSLHDLVNLSRELGSWQKVLTEQVSALKQQRKLTKVQSVKTEDELTDCLRDLKTTQASLKAAQEAQPPLRKRVNELKRAINLYQDRITTANHDSDNLTRTLAINRKSVQTVLEARAKTGSSLLNNSLFGRSQSLSALDKKKNKNEAVRDHDFDETKSRLASLQKQHNQSTQTVLMLDGEADALRLAIKAGEKQYRNDLKRILGSRKKTQKHADGLQHMIDVEEAKLAEMKHTTPSSKLQSQQDERVLNELVAATEKTSTSIRLLKAGREAAVISLRASRQRLPIAERELAQNEATITKLTSKLEKLDGIRNGLTSSVENIGWQGLVDAEDLEACTTMLAKAIAKHVTVRDSVASELEKRYGKRYGDRRIFARTPAFVDPVLRLGVKERVAQAVSLLWKVDSQPEVVGILYLVPQRDLMMFVPDTTVTFMPRPAQIKLIQPLRVHLSDVKDALPCPPLPSIKLLGLSKTDRVAALTLHVASPESCSSSEHKQSDNDNALITVTVTGHSVDVQCLQRVLCYLQTPHHGQQEPGAEDTMLPRRASDAGLTPALVARAAYIIGEELKQAKVPVLIGNSAPDNESNSKPETKHAPWEDDEEKEDCSALISAYLLKDLIRKTPRVLHTWQCVYHMRTDGASLTALLDRYPRRAGPASILLVKDTHGAVFGAFSQPSITHLAHQTGHEYSGDDESFVFALPMPLASRYHHALRPLQHTQQSSRSHGICCWFYSGKNSYHLLHGSEDGGFLAIGGGINETTRVASDFALRLDKRLACGVSGHCFTYDSPPLASVHDFEILDVELWECSDI